MVIFAERVLIFYVVQGLAFSFSEDIDAEDDNAHSCTLLQVASNLQVHVRSVKHSESRREAHDASRAVAVAATVRKEFREHPKVANMEKMSDCVYAMSYLMFFLYLLVGFRPTCQILVRLLFNGNSVSRPKSESLEGSFESRITKAEPPVVPPPMLGEAGLLDILPSLAGQNENVAIVGADSGNSISYGALRAMVADPNWDQVVKYDCVALALGPGVELATSLMCVMARTKCVPLDPNLSQEEAVFALQQFNASCIVLDPNAASGVAAAAASLTLTTFLLDRPASAMQDLFNFYPKEISRGTDKAANPLRWNTPEDVVLLLRTSGTTGKSKVVPLLLRQVAQGARAIAASMNLGQEDVCLNAMPLFHIGGISCNFLAVLASGGSVVVFEKTFNPRSFATILTEERKTPKPTWYYATPSMHLAIVDSIESVEEHSLRLVRSGAAALSIALQERLEEFFGCVVLATCSMTECMPVASSMLGETDSSEKAVRRVQPLGSVGKPLGPTVEIHAGEIMLRGSLVTLGYWGTESGWKDGLFATGDLGHIDEEGFLWLTGRKKEVINQGGETIAPQELEDTVVAYAGVKEVAAYPVLHERLGEAVALAICLEGKSASLKSGSDLQDLAQSISSLLAPGRRPMLVSFVSSLSRTSTFKVQRLKNPWCCEGTSKKMIISGDERQIIVLDARDLPPERYDSARRITPEAGTYASIIDLETSAEHAQSQAEEMYDSLGMLQSVSAKENFELRLASQLYVLGMLGITLMHLSLYGEGYWTSNAQILAELRTPGLHMFLSALKQNWHLSLFFVSGGYLDSQYHPNLGARDVATYMLVLTIPLSEGLPSSWAGYEHPARWFLFCLLICRLHMAFQRYYDVPKPLFLVIAVFSSNVMQNLIVWSQTLTAPDTVMHFVTKILFHVDSTWCKFVEGVVAYMVAAMWLPDLVRVAARWGPRSHRGEKILGLMLWIVFFVFALVMTKTMQVGQLSIDLGNYRLEHHWNLFSLPDFKLLVPIGLVSTLGHVCLLAAAMAYLPLTLPDVYLNASFGALLIIPVTITVWFGNLTGYCLFEMEQPALVRIFMFLCSYSLYFAVLSPLFQTCVGRIMTIGTACGTRLYQILLGIGDSKN